MSSSDISRAMEHYEDNIHFQNLTKREQEIICFLDTVSPLNGGAEQVVDV